MIIITSNSYSCTCEGMIAIKRSKRGRVITNSTNQIKKEDSVRVVTELSSVSITNMDQENYDILLDIFSYENSFVIEDTNRNIKLGNFIIDSEELSLQDIENKKEKSYYYTGNLPNLKRV